MPRHTDDPDQCCRCGGGDMPCIGYNRGGCRGEEQPHNGQGGGCDGLLCQGAVCPQPTGGG